MNQKKNDVDMRTVLCRTLIELSEKDDRLVWLDADLMASSGMKELKARFPDRVFNCGIAEANMAGVAAGLSAEGMIPFIHSFSAFSSRRIADQIFVSGVYAGLDIRIIGSDPGVSAAPNGGTHMSLEDVGILRSMPNTIILDPSDAVELREVIRQSTEKKGVYYIRLTRKSLLQFYDEGTTFTIGRASLYRDGTDLTIIASGTVCLHEAEKAADILAEQGIRARILDMFTVKPLDGEAVLRAARETGAILTVENHNIYNGLGSAVSEVLAESGSGIPFRRLGAPDCTGEVGTVDYLLEKYGMSSRDIAACALELLAKKHPVNQ